MKHYILFPLLAGLSALWLAAVRRLIPAPKLAAAVQWLPLPFLVAYMWRASQPARFLNDFKRAYYPSAELVRDGEAERLYDVFPLAFTNIPIVAWLFVPLASFSPNTAGLVFTALGLLAVAGTAWLLARYLRLAGTRLAVFVVALAANGPLYYSLREGNTTHFVWLALVVALLCSESNRGRLAGVLIGLAVIIKPPLALVLLPFAARGKWDTVVAGAGTIAAIIAGSFALYGVDLHREWYEASVEPFGLHPLGASTVQSLDAVFARLLLGDDYITDYQPIEELGGVFWAARTTLVAALALIGAAVCLRWRTSDARVMLRQEMCLAIVLALIAAPTSWVHYYLLLLLPIALALGGGLALPDSRPWWILLGIAIVLLSPPVVALDVESALVRQFMARIGFAHYFLGGILLAGIVLAARISLVRRRDPVPALRESARLAT